MKLLEEDVWPPGFRFHPTDEELILFYLKRKICKKRIKFDIIAETDVYKWDPEELPGQSLLKTGDRQWFFFSPRDRKYPNGARSNRATRLGYWKATGKDRNIACCSRNVGVKKTLVFYRGRAPSGVRTDWVMHEYTLDEDELKRCQNVQDYYALYKVFKKSGPGPKNGEQYGAPFKEEIWDNDDGQDVTNSVPLDIHPQQLDEVAPVYSDQAPSLLDDLEEFMRQYCDEPVPSQPQNSYPSELPQAAVEEEAQSTLVNVSSGEVNYPEPVRESTLVNVSSREVNYPEPVRESTLVNVPSREVNYPEPVRESTLVNVSSWDVTYPEPVREFNDTPSFGFAQSASYNLPPYEASEVTSARRNSEQVVQLGEEDFLEMDDLIGPEPTISPVEKPEEKVQFDEFDALNELDLFHDVAMFFDDLESVDHEIVTSALGDNMVNQVDYRIQAHSMVNHVDHQLQPHSVVDHVDYQLQPHSMLNQVHHQYQPNLVVNPVDDDMQFQSRGGVYTGSLMWMEDQIRNGFNPGQVDQQVSCPPTSGFVQESTSPPTADQNQNGREGGGARSWFSSSLWDFVDSIPTTPASAAENPLVNRAFERMSSFSRIRINAINLNVATGDDAVIRRQAAGTSSSSSKRFLILSIFGALCAILWMLMGNMRFLGRGIFS